MGCHLLTLPFFVILSVKVVTDESKQFREKITNKRKKKVEVSDDMKTKYNKHREDFGNSREPLLEGLTSDHDLDLFRQAQAMACEELVSFNYWLWNKAV